MYILLEDAKHHLNVDKDFHDDDYYITNLIDVAEKVVERNIDTNLSDLEDSDGDIPSPLKQAMLLLIGNFYANRESVAFASSSEVPQSYNYLIDLYRNYRGENLKKKKCLEWHLEYNKEQKEKEDEESGTTDEDNQGTDTDNNG